MKNDQVDAHHAHAREASPDVIRTDQHVEAVRAAATTRILRTQTNLRRVQRGLKGRSAGAGERRHSRIATLGNSRSGLLVAGEAVG
jgi:hypothetical protein